MIKVPSHTHAGRTTGPSAEFVPNHPMSLTSSERRPFRGGWGMKCVHAWQPRLQHEALHAFISIIFFEYQNPKPARAQSRY